MPGIIVQVTLDPKFNAERRAYRLYRSEEKEGRTPQVSGLYIPNGELPSPPPRELNVLIEYKRPMGFLS